MTMNPYKILIVDDNRNNVFTLREVLSAVDGCEIIEALSGEQALVAAIEEEIHLILLDVQMPGMDGFETARHLKMAKKTMDIPIIFITAVFKAEEFIERGYELGAIDYLTKPIDDNLLLNRVNLYRKLFIREDELKSALKILQEKEAMLIHQSRMAAMGEMLGAIAHQWRQPLNILALALIDLKDSFEYKDLTADSISNIVKISMEQIQYMSKTIDDFRNFFKPDRYKIPFSLYDVVKEALDLVQIQMTSHFIDSCIEYHNNTMSVNNQDAVLFGYPGELKQVILNIINNAKDAIIARQQTDKCFKGMVCIKIFQDDSKVVIHIEDNGGGISHDIIENIFEPYFTTKRHFKGTGIGLYMAKVIIEKHMGGKIFAENYNEGARFVIELLLNNELSYEKNSFYDFELNH